MLGSISHSLAAVPGLMAPATLEQQDAFTAVADTLGGDSAPGPAVSAKHGPE